MNTNYQKDFVPYEEALALKEIGFDERCMGHYWEGLFYFQTTHHHPSTMPNSSESCLAPLYQQAFRWFREKHGLSGNIDCCDKLCEWNIKSSKLDKSIFSNNIQSYEEAELACLKNLIEIVKEEKL
jgi:hypothetical protein